MKNVLPLCLILSLLTPSLHAASRTFDQLGSALHLEPIGPHGGLTLYTVPESFSLRADALLGYPEKLCTLSNRIFNIISKASSVALYEGCGAFIDPLNNLLLTAEPHDKTYDSIAVLPLLDRTNDLIYTLHHIIAGGERPLFTGRSAQQGDNLLHLNELFTQLISACPADLLLRDIKTSPLRDLVERFTEQLRTSQETSLSRSCVAEAHIAVAMTACADPVAATMKLPRDAVKPAAHASPLLAPRIPSPSSSAGGSTVVSCDIEPLKAMTVAPFVPLTVRASTAAAADKTVEVLCTTHSIDGVVTPLCKHGVNLLSRYGECPHLRVAETQLCSEQNAVYKHNQEDDIAIVYKQSHGFFGVFDGHGTAAGHGTVVSDFIAQYLPFKIDHELAKISSPSDDQLCALIKQAFLTANQALCCHPKTHAIAWGAGTTAATAMVLGNRLVVAHCGDSQVFVFFTDGTYWVTKDHDIHDPAERERIKRAGCVITDGYVQTILSYEAVTEGNEDTHEGYRTAGLFNASRQFGQDVINSKALNDALRAAKEACICSTDIRCRCLLAAKIIALAHPPASPHSTFLSGKDATTAEPDVAIFDLRTVACVVIVSDGVVNPHPSRPLPGSPREHYTSYKIGLYEKELVGLVQAHLKPGASCAGMAAELVGEARRQPKDEYAWVGSMDNATALVVRFNNNMEPIAAKPAACGAGSGEGVTPLSR